MTARMAFGTARAAARLGAGRLGAGRLGALVLGIGLAAGAAGTADARDGAAGAGAQAPVLAQAVQAAAPTAALAPEPIPDAREATGRVTGRALPRFAALKRERARVRRGPGRTYRVDWEFVRRGMPLEIVAEHGNWRRVRDVDGAGGWVHYALLSGRRSAIVMADMLPLRARPNAGAPETARAEAGAILRVERCDGGWCRVSGESARGWAPDAALWGVRAGEQFD